METLLYLLAGFSLGVLTVIVWLFINTDPWD